MPRITYAVFRNLPHYHSETSKRKACVNAQFILIHPRALHAIYQCKSILP